MWCKGNLPADFFKPTDTIITCYIAVTQWANTKAAHYTTGALAEFLEANEADAWLVAYCLANGNSIVTHEIGDPNGKKKIKIPDACFPHNITCVNTIGMFRMLGQRF